MCNPNTSIISHCENGGWVETSVACPDGCSSDLGTQMFDDLDSAKLNVCAPPAMISCDDYYYACVKMDGSTQSSPAKCPLVSTAGVCTSNNNYNIFSIQNGTATINCSYANEFGCEDLTSISSQKAIISKLKELQEYTCSSNSGAERPEPLILDCTCPTNDLHDRYYIEAAFDTADYNYSDYKAKTQLYVKSSKQTNSATRCDIAISAITPVTQ